MARPLSWPDLSAPPPPARATGLQPTSSSPSPAPSGNRFWRPASMKKPSIPGRWNNSYGPSWTFSMPTAAILAWVPSRRCRLAQPGTAGARRLADLFDRYAVRRPGLVQQWCDGNDVDVLGRPLSPHDSWQPQLWRLVRERIGQPSPVERLPGTARGTATGLSRWICRPGWPCSASLPFRTALPFWSWRKPWPLNGICTCSSSTPRRPRPAVCEPGPWGHPPSVRCVPMTIPTTECTTRSSEVGGAPTGSGRCCSPRLSHTVSLSRDRLRRHRRRAPAPPPDTHPV